MFAPTAAQTNAQRLDRQQYAANTIVGGNFTDILQNSKAMTIRQILLIIFFSIGQLGFGQSKFQKIDVYLDSIYKIGGFDGNILIADKGKVVYKKSVGYANDSLKIKLKDNSVFYLASVSKQFIATSIVMLKEKGLLNYDDKIIKYIPELSNYDNITIRNLLTHTSGLPDYWEVIDTLKIQPKKHNNNTLITTFSKLKPKLLFEPNTKWEYSNTGYDLLTCIIERITGMSINNYLQKTIFKPLKMNSTMAYKGREENKKMPNYAYGYQYSDSLKKYEIGIENLSIDKYAWCDEFIGAGGINSTTLDLLKWDRALYTNKLFSNASKKVMFTSLVLSDSNKTNYGFGWMIEDNGVYGNIVKHTGGYSGYYTIFERHIQNDKTIIILLNHLNNKTESHIDDLRKLVYDIEPIKYIKLDKESTEQFAGDYKNDEGKLRKIVYENGKLFRVIDDSEKVELRPISKTKFQAMNAFPDVFYEFVIKDKKVEKYVLTQPERRLIIEYIREK